MSKLTTLSQVSDVANAVINKVKDKGYSVGTYTIKKQAQAESGYAHTYQLFNVVGEGATAVETAVGEKINIPKDMVVQSATVETVTTADVPYQGAVVGDKYIDMVIANSGGDHVYIPVNDLFNEYSAGNGIDISNSVIAIKIDSSNANGLSATSNGLKLDTATTSASGAMSAADKTKLDGLVNVTVDSAMSSSSTNPVQNKVVNTALSNKVDKVSGKGLSTNDYTTADKTKLDGLSADDMECLKNMLYPRILVTGTANTAFTLTKGSRTINGTVGSGGSTEVLVPEIGAWALTMGGTTKYYFITAPMTYNDEAIAVSTTLANNTPDVIQKVAQAGMASNFWSVGDKIGIALSGTVGSLSISGTYYAFILGFDHNASIEGSNSIHFALGMTSGGTKIAFVDSSYNTQISTNGFNMNTSNTNAGGWNGSQMRTNIMPAIKNALPLAWRSVIKATTKYSDNTGGGNDTASYVTSTSDEIFLPAEFEVYGARAYANSAEQNKQKQYDYFKNGNSKICYKHNDTSSACNVWCRSVLASYGDSFCIVNSSGNETAYSAKFSLGVFSGFRVA